MRTLDQGAAQEVTKLGFAWTQRVRGHGAEGFVGQDERRGTRALSRVRGRGLTLGEGRARVSSGCLTEFASSGGRGGQPSCADGEPTPGRTLDAEGVHGGRTDKAPRAP